MISTVLYFLLLFIINKNVVQNYSLNEKFEYIEYIYEDSSASLARKKNKVMYVN